MISSLVVSPEAPYPLAGGGAIRTASLLNYLATQGPVDLITFREPGQPDPGDHLPAGLVRDVRFIDLPQHSRTPLARAWRNVARAARNVPPLVDRFGGFKLPIIESRHYDVGLIEHLWCAPYVDALRACCGRVVLDLHNIESRLLGTSAAAAPWPASTLLRRFSRASRRAEEKWIREFDATLVCSEADRMDARSIVYPNALPYTPRPTLAREPVIVFSGNLEYLPNQTAAMWFASKVWPQIHERYPHVRWKLLGRNEATLRQRIHGPNIEFTGVVDDALAHLASACVSVVPIQSGSGTRIKILEAWAAGTPVVSTSLGAEGLDARDGTELLLADSPDAFADRVGEILDQPDLAAKLSKGGRVIYEKRYTWQAAWHLLAASQVLSSP